MSELTVIFFVGAHDGPISWYNITASFGLVTRPFRKPKKRRGFGFHPFRVTIHFHLACVLSHLRLVLVSHSPKSLHFVSSPAAGEEFSDFALPCLPWYTFPICLLPPFCLVCGRLLLHAWATVTCSVFANEDTTENWVDIFLPTSIHT